MKTPAVLLCLFSLLITSATLAEVYRWTDENGRVHFSDKPPRNRTAEDISEQLRSTNVDESSSEREKLKTLFAPESPEEKRLRQQKQAQAAAAQQQREARCTQAREQLRAFTERRFYWVDDVGNTENASEAERQQAINTLTAAIARHCG